ncbi:MAG: metallophosphoesterase [Corynebacterium sp.]|uniref:metallophosphoesterase n=1 Tax=Corynebacterium sp. TaxID=1720 RepID=UPI0026DC1875|nr:metallophosphoesterase [Corynebacterium sp.]MDO5030594.1 metallophosphoesterase [Corynebacterium sp.]
MALVYGNKKINRRTALRFGALAGASATAVVANGVGTRPVALAAPNQAPFPFTGLTSGLVVTDLEVVTVTDTSVTFSWATYDGPHPAWGKLAPLAPSDTEVALAPADAGGELPVVHKDDSQVGYHFVTIENLQPGTTYQFECRSNGLVAEPGLITRNLPNAPEQTGRFTTLEAPTGEYLTTIAIVNDTHIGENGHGIIVGNFPAPIYPEAGAAPYPEVMLTGALAEISALGIGKVFVNGDATSEARPAEVRRFAEIMNTFGVQGQQWFVTRGNHDRPHKPEADPAAGYDEFQVLEGTDDHRDPFGVILNRPRQQLWVTQQGPVRVIGLDSSKLDQSGGEIDEAQFVALEAELQYNPTQPTVVLAHHPVTTEAGLTNAGGPTFILNSRDRKRLQRLLNDAPGVFFSGAGHTHRAKRTRGDIGAGVDYVETGACKAYPGGYTLLHVYTGGYQVNFHRVSSDDALSWTARARWAMYGFEPEALLGELGDRNYVVKRAIA